MPRRTRATSTPTATSVRHGTHVDKRHVHYDGLMRLEAMLDLADALDVDQALAHGGAAQKALGSTASLDARRAAALGDLAARRPRSTSSTRATRTTSPARLPRLRSRGARPSRDDEGRGFEARSARTSTTEPPRRDGPDLPTAREVVLHAHFDAGTTEQGVTVFGPTGRLEEGQRLLLLEQLRSWCTDSRTRVTIKPVIDLNTDLSTSGYVVPDRIREQVVLQRRHLRVSVVHPPRPALRHRPRRASSTTTPTPRADPNPARPPRPTWPRCAGSTTGSRRTAPGATRRPRPGCSSGPAPTATGTAATTPAPSASSPNDGLATNGLVTDARASSSTSTDPPPPIPRQRRP